MNELVLILTGAAISLVSSVAVTWVQGLRLGRTQDRSVARESARQLTTLFIEVRDAAGGIGAAEGTATLAEAEVVSAGITDRGIRERVQSLVRLLRESHLRELEELSGVRSARAVTLLCDHALEVLGAHFRGEKTPALPEPVRKMLAVEDEALGIRAGGPSSSTSRSGAATAAKASTVEAPSSRKVRQRPRATGGDDAR